MFTLLRLPREEKKSKGNEEIKMDKLGTRGNKIIRSTYKSSEVVALPFEGMAKPDVAPEVIHVQHQSPHSILKD